MSFDDHDLAAGHFVEEAKKVLSSLRGWNAFHMYIVQRSAEAVNGRDMLSQNASVSVNTTAFPSGRSLAATSRT